MNMNDRALFRAVAQRKLKLLRILIEGGIDVNCQNYDGKTPLMTACCFLSEYEEGGKLETAIKLLLVYKANPNVQDVYGNTALMYGFRHLLSPNIIKCILDNGGDLTIRANNGRNALNFITSQNWSKYIEVIQPYLECKQHMSKSKSSNQLDTDNKHREKRDFLIVTKSRSVGTNDSELSNTLTVEPYIMARRHSDGIAESGRTTKMNLERNVGNPDIRYIQHGCDEIAMSSNIPNCTGNPCHESNFDNKCRNIEIKIIKDDELDLQGNTRFNDRRRFSLPGFSRGPIVEEAIEYAVEDISHSKQCPTTLQKNLRTSQSMISVSNVDRDFLNKGYIIQDLKLPPIL